ncbi:hypothetical protein GE061_017836 [Apolygus lucorum]|uniref:Carboxylesterase type B domain-containing protein n=1 Tax=Apolygus lucorum TaxID=248454 RepID=A0A8S9XC08_APOLU|nr:hypothetical protein GE061_017836 [Apolygus lucorum]
METFENSPFNTKSMMKMAEAGFIYLRQAYINKHLNERNDLSYPQLVQKRATEFYSKAGNTFRAQPYYVARDAVLGILNDVRVVNPVIQTALHHSNSNPLAQTFLYVFTHKSSKSEYTGTDESVQGEELPYIFGVPLGGQINHFQSTYNHHEKLLSEVMMTMWSNFVKTGDPNSPKKYNYLTLTAKDWAYFEKLKWPIFEAHNQSYYKFALRPSIGSWYRSEYMEFWNSDLPTYLDKHEKNMNEREENFFFRPPFVKSNPSRSYDREPDRPSKAWSNPPSRPSNPGPYGTVINYPSETREKRPGSFYKLATLKPKVHEVMEEGVPEEHPEVEETENNEVTSLIDTASTFGISVIVIIGLAFVVVNIFLFVFFIRQRRKMCISSNYPGRFGCGPSPSLPDSNMEARDEKYEIKSILKSADQLYDAVVKRQEEWPDIYRPGSSSTVTIDPHTKVAEWMGQKVKNTNLKQSNVARNKTDRSSDTDNASAATTSKACEKKAVKKVSVAIDATPSARSASVLKQIPIELTKSLDYGKRRFGLGRLRKEGAISEDESPSPSHKHSLSDPVDFPPPPPTASVSERMLSSFNPHSVDINVTSRDERQPHPLSPEEALDNIKRRNFPKVLPDFPEDEPEGAARLKRMSLPHPAETLKELGRKNPPPPPPRVSTLARKPTSNRNSAPNPALAQRDMEKIHDKSRHDSKRDKVEKRPEPRVIIKPTLTDPNAKKNPNSKIPRVTSKHTEKQPPPSPSAPSKHPQVKDPPKKPPGGVGAKLKVPPVKKTGSTETNATSGTSGSSVSSVATVKKSHGD